MGSQQETVVHSWVDCYFTQDLTAVMDLYADDAAYHRDAWKPPFVGREAIRAEIAQQFGATSDYRITISNLISTDALVFIEGVDNFRYGGKDITMHWSSVWELNPAGKITAQRDYADSAEFRGQIA